MTKLQAYEEFGKHNDAWSDELERIYGTDAGTARYDGRGKGEPGSRLNDLYIEYHHARAEWFKHLN